MAALYWCDTSSKGRVRRAYDAAESGDGDKGFLATLVGIARGKGVSSTLTRDLLGWHPVHPGLIEDLGKGHYFHRPSA